MEERYILAIDRGQTKIKAALCSPDGRVCHMESCRCQPIQSPKAGYAQQDMELIWHQTKEAIRRVLCTSEISPKAVAAVTFSGQGGGNFLVSESGEPLYPGILSLDTRHEEILSSFDDTGHAGIPRTIAFMRWLKEKEPEVYEQTRWILGSKDWIRYCLTGEANADMSDPPAPVDYDTGCYDLESLKNAGVTECERMLPPLVYASDLCGSVTAKAAGETGLLPGTPVAAGAHDMIACSVGTGGGRQGHLAIILGTLGINIAVVDQSTEVKKDVRPGESFVFGGIIKGQRMMTTSIGSGCNTMDRFIDLLFEKEKKEAKEKDMDVYRFIEEQIMGREPTDLIFQPYLMGTFYESAARASLFGVTADTKREDILLSLYEGISISMCMEIEKLEDRLSRFDDIWITGGGSKSRIWGQMFADILQREVRICTDEESGCRGSTVCAGIALGLYTLDDGFPLPKAGQVYRPCRSRAAIYAEKVKRYKQAFEMSAGLWTQHKK